MKKQIQTLLAMQLLSMQDNITTHNYNSGKIVEEQSLSVLQCLKSAVEEGLDIMLPLEQSQQTHTSNYLYGDSGKVTFIEAMMGSHDTNKEVVMFLYDQLKPEDLKNAHSRFVQNIYSVLFENQISMKKMFEIGFDFEQGKFDEESKAMSGDLDFFECCLYFKKDFNFNYKYDAEYTLKQNAQDELNYLKSNKANTNKLEGLLSFIEQAEQKQLMENSDNNLTKNVKLKM